MPDLLNRRNRGGSWDRSYPEPASRALGRPYASPNPYMDHRLSADTADGRHACDCGDAFDSATELGQHQQPFRHPRP
jgi:hypothetical protein